jgi:signal peptidase I
MDIENEGSRWNAMALAMGEQTRRELFLDTLKTSGKVRTIVGGNSMLPTLWVGDLLTVEAARADEISSGDIVVCFQAGRLCTHRVLERQGQHLVTRGDANLRIDAPVIAEECFGRVISAERNGRPIALRYRPMLSFLIRHSNLMRRIFYWSRVRQRSSNSSAGS